MSQEDSFTDARDLCNSTSNYAENLSDFQVEEIEKSSQNQKTFKSPDFNIKHQQKQITALNFDDFKGQKTDFQDDFMAKYDEFSESWREACKKMQRF